MVRLVRVAESGAEGLNSEQFTRLEGAHSGRLELPMLALVLGNLAQLVGLCRNCQRKR